MTWQKTVLVLLGAVAIAISVPLVLSLVLEPPATRRYPDGLRQDYWFGVLAMICLPFAGVWGFAVGWMMDTKDEEKPEYVDATAGRYSPQPEPHIRTRSAWEHHDTPDAEGPIVRSQRDFQRYLEE